MSIMERHIILEDWLECRLFPDLDATRGDGLEGKHVSSLQTLLRNVMERVHALSRDYLWQEDPLCLRLDQRPGRPAHLYGRMKLGDGVDDEWFVVSVLMVLTREFPTLIASVCDADGDFLLIEAAEHLPEWLEPENSANRVFIYRGNVHIVDIKDLQDPDIQTALEFIRKQPPRKTVANEAIQASIRARMGKLTQGPSGLHRARVVLPAKIAKVLQKHPQAVSPLVSAIGAFTPNDLSKASFLSHSVGKDAGLDLKSIQVAFTRNQFAKLLCLRINAPRAYPMPTTDDSDFLAHSLGLKLALGYEMACSQKTPFYYWDTLFDSFVLKPTLYSDPKLDVEDHVKEYYGPDDDVKWLDVEEGPLLNTLASQMDTLNLSPTDGEEILEKMLNEEDNPHMSSRLLEFMRASSGLEGIYYDPSKVEEEETDFYSEDTDSDSDFNSEEMEQDEGFLTKEILETILHDPDLLMKIIERGEEVGLEYGDLIERLRSMNKDSLSSTLATAGTQKGIADIDPAKLTEARQRSRPLPSMQGPKGVKDKIDIDLEAEDEGYIDSDEDKDEEIDVYDEPEKPSKTSYVNASEDEERELTSEEYMRAMDTELSLFASDRDGSTHHQAINNLRQSIDTEKSPAHGLLLNLIKK